MALFVIGAEHSGSELLAALLKQIPGLALQHPPDILRWMTPLVPTYGDLADDQRFMELIGDVCQIIELSPVPWHDIDLDREKIAALSSTRSLLGVFEVIYGLLADKQRASDWCCMSLANVQFLPAIEAHFGSKAKYIFLYRDGRDVAVSLRKSVEGEKHYYHIAKDWGQIQRLAKTMEKVIGADRFIPVRYEYMARDPEQTMTDLCGFLGINISEKLRQSTRSDEVTGALETVVVDKNNNTPILKGGVGKFRVEAREQDIQIFESVAGDALDALGYVRSAAPKGKEKFYREDQVRIFDLENEQLKKAVAASDGVPNRQAGFVRSIISRQQAISDEWLSRLDRSRER